MNPWCLRARAGHRSERLRRPRELRWTKAMVSSYERGGPLPSLRSLSSYLRAMGGNFRDLQDAIEHLGGRESVEGGSDIAEWEPLVGRVMLEVLRTLKSHYEIRALT